MDINIFISGMTIGVGAGAGAGLIWGLFRRALRVRRGDLPDNGSKPDKDKWLEDLRRRVTDLESHRTNINVRLIAVENQTDQVLRHEEDISSLERDVRGLRAERKRRPL